MKTVTMKLPVPLWIRLEKEASSRRVSKSLVLREALERHFKRSDVRQELSAFDLMQEGFGVVSLDKS